MKKHFLLAVAAAAAVMATMPAQASIVDFDTLPDECNQRPLSEGGLTFTTLTFTTSFYQCTLPGDGINASNGTQFYVHGYGTTNIVATGGGLFSISKLDIGRSFYTLSDELVTLTGFISGGGTVTQIAPAGSTFSTETLTGFTNLTSFTISQLTAPGQRGPGGFLALDNINVSFGPSAIPEPAAWALMLAGFGLVGGAMRRRQATVRVTYA